MEKNSKLKFLFLFLLLIYTIMNAPKKWTILNRNDKQDDKRIGYN